MYEKFLNPTTLREMQNKQQWDNIFAHQMYRNESDSERVWGNWKSHNVSKNKTL